MTFKNYRLFFFLVKNVNDRLYLYRKEKLEQTSQKFQLTKIQKYNLNTHNYMLL